MGLLAERVIRSDAAKKAIETLIASKDKPSASILRAVRAIETRLKVDCLCGEVVKKSQIPAALKTKYGIENLYMGDLPSFWRLLYTIARDGITRYVIILEIVDHDDYNKWFP